MGTNTQVIARRSAAASAPPPPAKNAIIPCTRWEAGVSPGWTLAVTMTIRLCLHSAPLITCPSLSALHVVDSVLVSANIYIYQITSPRKLFILVILKSDLFDQSIPNNVKFDFENKSTVAGWTHRYRELAVNFKDSCRFMHIHAGLCIFVHVFDMHACFLNRSGCWDWNEFHGIRIDSHACLCIFIHLFRYSCKFLQEVCLLRQERVT